MYAHHDLLEERTSLLARLGVKGSGDDSHFEAKARSSIFFASVPEEPTENLDVLTSKLQARPKCAVLDSSSDSAPDTSGEQQPELFVVQEKQKHKIVKGQIDDWEPQLETELYMQKKDRRWKKKWIGYANTTLRKQETKHQKSGFYKTSQVVYCDQRRSRRCILDPFLPNDKIIYIQTDRDKYMFQVYTNDKVHNFKCATKKECVRWYSTIREDLMRFYTAQEWAEKQELAKDLNRVLRAQFNFELLRYTQLLFRIANAGLFETHFFDEQGSTSMAGVMEILIEKKRLKGFDESVPDTDPSLLHPTMKDAPPPLLGVSVETVAGSTMESGILGSSSGGDEEHEEGEKDDEQKVWKEFYFVMADAVLLLFKSSKAKEPSSVLALKYATVYVDEAALRSGQYIWCISSPMGRFYFRAKHDVVLSEWLYAADKEIRGRKRINKSSSSSILEKLYRIQTDLSTMRHVIESPEGRKTLNKYLRDVRDEEGLGELQLWKAIARAHSHTSTPEDRKRGRPVLAKLLRDPVRMQKLLTPPTPPPMERKHKPSKSSKSEKETKELFENPRDSFPDQDSDFDDKDEENETPPTVITKIDDVVGWRYVSQLLVQRLHHKHFHTFAKTADYEALKKYLAHRWTPKRESGSDRTSRRPSRHNSTHNSHNSSDTLGTSPTQASVLSSGGGSTSSSTSGISGEIKLGKPTIETVVSLGIDGKEKEKKEKEKDIKEKEPPDKTGLIEEDKDPEPFDPSTVQLSIEFLRKTGRDKETVIKKIIKLPKNRDHIGIGRASSNSVRLPDPGVSRTHGRIEWKTKTLIYIDLGSAYGTKLNGESIKRAVLQIGDVLKMGKNSTIIVQSRVKSKSKLSMCRVM